jgi:hypothetical protein
MSRTWHTERKGEKKTPEGRRDLTDLGSGKAVEYRDLLIQGLGHENQIGIAGCVSPSKARSSYGYVMA